MAASAATSCSKNFNFHGISISKIFTSRLPVSSIAFPQSYKPIKYSRLRVSHRTKNLSEDIFRVQRISCLVEDNFDALSDSSKEASIDLKLPRRSLLVSFTCNSCGERSQRLINRLAYERGTIFLQCAGCLKYHKFVDNLELVVEYNYLEEDDNIASNVDKI